MTIKVQYQDFPPVYRKKEKGSVRQTLDSKITKGPVTNSFVSELSSLYNYKYFKTNVE